ncbi:hypothetical protein D3C73_1390690 [compost metagenome]
MVGRIRIPYHGPVTAIDYKTHRTILYASVLVYNTQPVKIIALQQTFIGIFIMLTTAGRYTTQVSKGSAICRFFYFIPDDTSFLCHFPVQ